MSWIAKLVEVPTYSSDSGSLAVVERSHSLPFDPVRAYFIFDVPNWSSRGFHAHKNLEQLMIAVAGSLSVLVDDGSVRREFELDSPSRGLLIGPGAWREMHRFAPGTICLVLASEKFDETDYIRDYQDFVSWRESNC